MQVRGCLAILTLLWSARGRVAIGHKTLCPVAVSVADAGFYVTYTLNKFHPVTVPVQVIYMPGVPIQRGPRCRSRQAADCLDCIVRRIVCRAHHA
jgi:hypothetical protein